MVEETKARVKEKDVIVRIRPGTLHYRALLTLARFYDYKSIPDLVRFLIEKQNNAIKEL